MNVWYAAVTYNLLYIPKDVVLCAVAAIVAFKVAPLLFKAKSDNAKNAVSSDKSDNDRAANDDSAEQTK